MIYSNPTACKASQEGGKKFRSRCSLHYGLASASYTPDSNRNKNTSVAVFSYVVSSFGNENLCLRTNESRLNR